MHCSTGLGKLYCQLFSCALQTRLTAGLCQCSYTFRDLLSYRYAESQQKCTAALVKAKCISNCLGVLCKPGSQQACVNATTSMENCSHIGGNESTEMHCSTGQGKMYSQLFSCALQDRLTAGMCQCNHIYGDLLSYRCREPTETASRHLSSRRLQLTFSLLWPARLMGRRVRPLTQTSFVLLA